MRQSTEIEQQQPLVSDLERADESRRGSICSQYSARGAGAVTTSALISTISASTVMLCSALIVSLYRHPLWVQQILDVSRMPSCPHHQKQNQHQHSDPSSDPSSDPNQQLTEIPQSMFYACSVIYAVAASMLYHLRRRRGDAHQDPLVAAGILLGLTAGFGLGMDLDDVMRVSLLWCLTATLVGSAVGHEVMLIVWGDEEDEEECEEYEYADEVVVPQERNEKEMLAERYARV